ncbi:MAG: hypothetical protein Q8R74_14070 [Methylophilus sp.]|nr:hypothetical protein [Methylophilus sp.]
MLSFINTFNAEFLSKINCYLSGDEAIHLLTNQFREPTELRFVCASREGYATLVENLYNNDIGSLFLPGMAPKLLRNIKGDMYGRYMLVEFDGNPIKITFANAMFPVTSEPSSLPLATLSKESLFTEKLTALDDHIDSPYLLEKDIEDLMEMQRIWGDIQETTFATLSKRGADVYLKRLKTKST